MRASKNCEGDQSSPNLNGGEFAFVTAAGMTFDPEMIKVLRREEDMAEIKQMPFKEKYLKLMDYKVMSMKTI